MSNNPWGIQIRVYEPETTDELCLNIFQRVTQGGNIHLEPNGWKHYDKNHLQWDRPTLVIPGPDQQSVLQQLANQLREMGYVPESTRSEAVDMEKGDKTDGVY